MKDIYVRHVASLLQVKDWQVENCAELFAEGCTIPFISRYRKERTGGLSDVEVAEIKHWTEVFTEMEKRKASILGTIEEQGKLTPELRDQIENCVSSSILEDLYLPFRPKRKTRATVAVAKGLEPLADLLWSGKSRNPEADAAKFVKGEVASVDEALAGARDIIAERLSETAVVRENLRGIFRTRRVQSKATKAAQTDPAAAKYRTYFNYSNPISKIPSYSLLALLRAENEGFLKVSIDADAEKCGNKMYYDYCQEKGYPSRECGLEIRAAVDDAYKRLLESSITNEVIFPHPPAAKKVQAIMTVADLVEKYGIEVIAIGNGTAGRETEDFIRKVGLPESVRVFSVSEDGASVYSASEVAREEFPDEDVTVRGAVSIGRRLMDPLAELVKIDPKSLGIGQYQHDVDQTLLHEQLDNTVESCVNSVGVNLNTASPYLLQYVSGIGPTLADNIVAYRAKAGGYKSRRQLMEVPRLGEKAFQQCAGFLRIQGAENPLDGSAVHPESYHIVDRMARDLGVSTRELVGNADLCRKIKAQDYVEGDFGLPTINDILKELAKPGRDPRDEVREFSFADDIHEIDDLKVGMELPGIVTNLTAFGAFVDIGLHDNGLIHATKMGVRGMADPSKILKLHQHVLVEVVSVDLERNRIGLRLIDKKA